MDRFRVIEGMQHYYVVDRWRGLDVIEETTDKETARKIASKLNREQMKRYTEVFGAAFRAGMKEQVKLFHKMVEELGQTQTSLLKDLGRWNGSGK